MVCETRTTAVLKNNKNYFHTFVEYLSKRKYRKSIFSLNTLIVPCLLFKILCLIKGEAIYLLLLLKNMASNEQSQV